MMRRFVLLAALLAALGVPTKARLHAQAAPPIETIRAAYTLLLDRFYRQPDPRDLLTAAWAGATGALSATGYTDDPPPPPAFSGDREGDWAAFAGAYPTLEALLPAGMTPNDLALATVAGMADSLDEEHTRLLRPEQYQIFARQLAGDFGGEGLGVVVAPRPPWVVQEVAPGSPAEQAGVRPGDTIVAVDGVDVTAGGRAQLDQALTGPAGSIVQLDLDAPEGHVELSVTRGAFSLPAVEARVLPDGAGYLRIRAFTTFLDAPGGTPSLLRQVDDALASFARAGTPAWVLDLRDNPGGLPFTAAEVLGRFLPPVVIATASDDRGDSGDLIAAGPPVPVQRPMAVLVNGATSSAAEVVAAALQGYGRAVVVGEPTPGAAAGWRVFSLPDGAALQVTVAQDRIGGWDSASHAGVVPDVPADDTRTAADYAAGRDPQLDAAVAAAQSMAMKNAPAAGAEPPVSGGALTALLDPYLPPAAEIGAAGLSFTPRLLGDLVLTRPEEYVAQLGPVAGAGDAVRRMRDRGWQGSVTRYYGATSAPVGSQVRVTVDLYASADGAEAALKAADAAALRRPVDPAPPGAEGFTAWAGAWTEAGTAALSWWAGRAVVTVAVQDTTGQVSFDPAVAIARVIQDRLRATPLPIP